MGKLSDVCIRENIQVCQTSAEALNNFTGNLMGGGIAFQRNGKKYIALDETLSGWKKLLVLAHETAHHIFGHLDTLENWEISEDFEDEARLFSVVYAALYMFAGNGVNA